MTRHVPEVRAVVLTVLALALLAGTLLAPVGGARAAAPPAPVDGRRINELAAPAVRLVVVSYDAQVLIYPPEVDRAAVQAWVRTPKVARDLLAGGDPEALVVEALTADPDRFLSPGRTPQTRRVSTQSVGSGFVVTPDGYVVTNAHVVESSSDQLKAGLLRTALGPLVEDLADEIGNELGGSYDQATLRALNTSLAGFMARSMEVAKVTNTVQTAEGTQVPGLDKEFKLTTAEIVTQGVGYPGKDVAVLKVDGKDLPTLPLGDDATVDTGERLYALGYPANVTFLKDFKKSAQSTATLTDGVVSAKRQTEGGYTAIQTNATISGGNSGGPALDDSGRVVGLTTAGLVTGRDSTGGAYSFVVPVGVAREFLQRIGVTPVESQTTTLWRQALDDMDRRYHSRAAATLRRLDNLNPGRPDVQTRLREADAAVAAGDDETPSGLPGWATWSIAVGVVALLAGLALLLLRRQRRARAAAAPAPELAYAGASGSGSAPVHGQAGEQPYVPAGQHGQPGPYEQPGQYGPPQYGPPQYAPGQYASGQYGPPQHAPGQYGAPQHAPGHYGTQYAPGQYGPPQHAAGQYAPGQYGPPQYAPGQYGPPQYAPGQYGPSEYAPGQYGPSQYAPGQYAPGQDGQPGDHAQPGHGQPPHPQPAHPQPPHSQPEQDGQPQDGQPQRMQPVAPQDDQGVPSSAAPRPPAHAPTDHHPPDRGSGSGGSSRLLPPV